MSDTLLSSTVEGYRRDLSQSVLLSQITEGLDRDLVNYKPIKSLLLGLGSWGREKKNKP